MVSSANRWRVSATDGWAGGAGWLFRITHGSSAVMSSAAVNRSGADGGVSSPLVALIGGQAGGAAAGGACDSETTNGPAGVDRAEAGAWLDENSEGGPDGLGDPSGVSGLTLAAPGRASGDTGI
jgi:hypothetical protein